MVGETEPGGAGTVEDNVLALQEDVAEDVEANAVARLDTTEASGATGLDGRVVDVLSRDALLDAVEDEGEVGEGGRAGEDVAAVGGAVGGTRDLGVVGLYDRVREVEKGGTGVGDAVDGRGDGGAAADGVAAEAELPPALRGVDVGVGERTGVLGTVDVAKIVSAGGVVLEVSGEDRLRKGALDGVEEGLLGCGADGVEGRE